ncbi:MAG: carbon-nitrogen hydrolase family protein [Candidatus Thorarchaeota archaeon]|nr:MAG: carbon-nitrogen hydrolase family protein [Candidatus Thorarchaeota archaeon]
MIRVAAIQMAPVFLNKEETSEKLESYIREAQDKGAEFITWGETLVPGYPFWLSPSGGAHFNDSGQKTAYATYWREALQLDSSPTLERMKSLAGELQIMLMGGIAEKEGASLYCTLVTIGPNGKLLGRHRKIKPTYEERLVWADGDGAGLRTHSLKDIRVGGLNCWENWLPLARAALHLQGEILHVAVWPGNLRNTEDITRFIALEGRSWVISVSGLLRPTDFSHLTESEFPMKSVMESHSENWANGGSVIVDPTGKIVEGPLVDEEGVVYADVDPTIAIQERQNLDISGHYSRFDIFNRPLADRAME